MPGPAAGLAVSSAAGAAGGLNPVGAALGAVQTGIGIYQTVAGMIDAKKARKELERLQQPFYKIQDEYIQNKNVAAQQAQLGLPQQTMDYLTTESQRGLGSSLEAIRGSGASPNAVSALYDTYSRGVSQTGAQDAAMRIQNLSAFMKQNSEMAGQKTMQWAINEYNPYLNKVANLQQRMQRAYGQVGSGLSDILGGGATYLTSQQNAGLLAAMKGKKDKGVDVNVDVGGGANWDE